MGKAGRAACITLPMVLSLASFVCILLINLGGYSKTSTTLNNINFFSINFTNFTTSSDSTSELALLLEAAKEDGDIADYYQVHLWNYCTANSTSTTNSSVDIDWCSSRKRDFYFNPLTVWNVESIINETETADSSDSSVVSTLESLASNSTALEDELLDSSAREALALYKKLSTWMWSAYFASLWLLLGTIVFGCLAIFSRWFSFFTWILSVLSTILVLGGSVTASIMFPILVKALKESFGDYGITFSTSMHTLIVTWLATAFTLVATFFWLFSVCCCSGSSNPHHRSNREAPAAGMWANRRNRNVDPEAEKMSGGAGGMSDGYAPVTAPYAARVHYGDHDADNVPLTSVPGAYGQDTSYGHGEAAEYYAGTGHAAPSPYEPYRYLNDSYRHN